MRIIKSFFISFSIYSKIPVPQFEWKEEDMRYTLCFFPWVGAVIGALELLWFWLCGRLGIGILCYTAIGTAIPLIISGGFHVDGFVDTMDAFHSYQNRERKLEILKDSHIGAFAVIMLMLYYLIYAGAFSEIRQWKSMGVLAAGFFASRCLSGIGVVSFPSAKSDGLLYLFASSAHEWIVKISLYVQLLLCFGWMLVIDILTGSAVILAALGSFAYYRYRSIKELGGITGDTAGYFVTVCEAAMVVAAAVMQYVG